MADLAIVGQENRRLVNYVAQALAPFHRRPRGFPQELPFIWDEATLRHSSVLKLQTAIGSIDLLAEAAGLGPYEEISAHFKIADAFGLRIPVLDIRSLIRAKRAAGREKGPLNDPGTGKPLGGERAGMTLRNTTAASPRPLAANPAASIHRAVCFRPAVR